VRDLGSLTFSRNGVPAIQDGAKLRATSFRLGWLSEAEMEETFSPIDEAIGKTSPLFLCFDPEPNTYRQRRTFFGYAEEQPEYQRQGFNRYSRDFRFLSLF
jgi:hypothetical protein